MNCVVLALLSFTVFASPDTLAELASYTFQDYLVEFGKSYDSHELSQRQALFQSSLDAVVQHNADPSHSWKMGINHFSDMSEAEMQRFKGKANTQLGVLMDPPPSFFDNLKPVSELPASVDWRDQDVVTPPKDQGGCGSCWAFSATEVMESHVAIQTGKLLTLSPQQMVSCAPNPNHCGGSGGCAGSVQWLGFNYTVTEGGLSLEADYPYKGITGTCDRANIKPKAGITGYVRLPPNDYTALMNAVATLGPISISLDASWGAYRSGVYTGKCGTTIDHAVVLVGYGTEDGLDYYLVRNSWGKYWGEEGYIKILRKANDSDNCGMDTRPADGTACEPYPKEQAVCGLCGLLSDSSYPTGGHLIN